jgi:hypothetical protein
MDNRTLKNIFKFLEDKGEHRMPFRLKVLNNIPITEEDLNVKGNFSLSNSDITSLPEGLKVDGYLSLRSTNITSLPEGLEVDGYLNVAYSSITSLPEGLEVGGDLYIKSTPLTKYLDNELREMVKPGFIKGEIYR